MVDEVARVLAEGPHVDGPWTHQAEEQLCDVTGAKHAVMFPSCSVAIQAALLAHVGAGKRVLFPDFTFIGSVAGAVQSGMKPVLADVTRDELTLDDEFVAVGADTTLRLADAVVPVDLHGVPHRWPRGTVQSRPVITDACQALGTKVGGRHVGSRGVHCWSFSAAKAAPSSLGGGAVTCDERWLSDWLRSIRDYGRVDGRAILRGGQNWRPPEAAMVLVCHSLSRLAYWAPRMHEVGEELRAAAAEGGRWVQQHDPAAEVAWHKVRVEGPVEGVPTHRWGRPLHTEPVLKSAVRQISGYPVANAASETVCLGTEAVPHWTWARPEIDRAVEVLRRNDG